MYLLILLIHDESIEMIFLFIIITYNSTITVVLVQLTITSWSDPITFVCVLLIDKILLVPFCDIIIDIDGMLTISTIHSLLISLVSSILYTTIPLHPN